MDFPITRSLINRLPGWVDKFAKKLPPPKKVPLDVGFRWEHEKKDAETLQVAKAVRMASGLHAAITLADARHTVECLSLLRMVSDFASEIEFIGEGLFEGRFTTEQRIFIDQNYSDLSASPDELAAREPLRPIGRKAVANAHGRLADKAGMDRSLLANNRAYVNRGYDGLVHGYYASAMDLFTGRTMNFMMTGHESDRHVCLAKIAVAGKVKEALNALRFMATTQGVTDLSEELQSAFDQLDQSREDTRSQLERLV